MQVSNVKYYSDLDFNEYLSLKGYSFSSLKMLESGQNKFEPTEGMKLGTRVHNFLLEPHKYDGVERERVGEIAKYIKLHLGTLLPHLEKELSISAMFTHNGYQMQYKGRLDLCIRGRLIIDLKILGGGLENAVNYFKYDRQVSGYSFANGSINAQIISYNKLKKRDAIETQMITPNQEWWNYVIQKYGNKINN
jgi:hypothetical protein